MVGSVCSIRACVPPSAGVAAVTADVLGRLLREKGLTIAVAESCTGGKLGDMITDVAGSSDYFLGGVVSYSNASKVDLLGVDRSVMDAKGAVSEEVAISMAQGVRGRLKADVGVGITGIAGPGGATPDKPVGLVYIAVSSGSGNACERHVFSGSRTAIKTKSAERALDLVLGYVRAHH